MYSLKLAREKAEEQHKRNCSNVGVPGWCGGVTVWGWEGAVGSQEGLGAGLLQGHEDLSAGRGDSGDQGPVRRPG